MSNTAVRHLVPLSGEDGEIFLPWETGAELSSDRQETWLLSFIDILALLLTLFVLLLAYQDHGPSEPNTSATVVEPSPSTTDFSLAALNPLNPEPVAWPLVTATTTDEGDALAGNGALPNAGRTGSHRFEDNASKLPETARVNEPATASREPEEPVKARATTPDGTRKIEMTPAGVTALAALPGNSQPQTSADQAMQRTRTAAGRLQARLNQTLLSDRVEMTVDRGVVNLNISDSILFSLASAALSRQGLTLLNTLAGVLKTLPYQLSVEGHTDNVPIRTARYPSNWELSAARAARVTRKLIVQGIVPGRIRAIGYGDTRPLGDNHTPKGRTKNRRVTFVLRVEDKPTAK